MIESPASIVLVLRIHDHKKIPYSFLLTSVTLQADYCIVSTEAAELWGAREHQPPKKLQVLIGIKLFAIMCLVS